ncbi:MAG TPA: carbon storage regulator [Gemmataceae bacterium]|nr:carbon storage regulator [Gemmataceae bacterium]
MLVLARQLHERIVMPTVPAVIEVVAIKPNGVRLGIDAPPEVTVLREEVLRRDCSSLSDPFVLSESDAQMRLHQIKHLLRNRLQAVALGLDLIRQQINDSGASELQGMLQRMEAEVSRIDQQLRVLLSASEPQGINAPSVSPYVVVESEGGLSI